jgi:two-component system response regulator AtoC
VCCEDAGLAADIGLVLERAGLRWECFEAIEAGPRMLVAAVRGVLPEGWAGWQGLKQRRQLGQSTLIVIVGEGPTIQGAARFLLAGASKAVFWEEDGAKARLDDWAARQAEEAANVDAADARMREFGIVSRSFAMRALFERLERAAEFSQLPILITGETGTGKELFARALHGLDQARQRGRFVAVNCAALNASLLESELFGHARGAYTGAERDRSGLLRSADGGVIFLDEIGELEAPLQAKLLRVLQAGVIQPLGQDREVSIDVRVVAATNRDLEAMVKAGSFREDLYYRLNAVRLRIPPLRERPEDIDVLVEHLLAGDARQVSCSLREALSRARFSGNVRQLENLLRAAVVQHRGSGPLDLEDCPFEFWQEMQAGPRMPVQSENVGLADLNLERALAIHEAAVVREALARTNGNQARAAELLGVTPRSVYNKLKKIGKSA